MSKKIEEQQAVEEITQDSQEAQAEDQVAAMCKSVVVLAENGLNLRCAPSSDAHISAVLPNGTALTVIPLPYGAESPNWFPVMCPDFRLGWVNRRYIEALAPAEEG